MNKKEPKVELVVAETHQLDSTKAQLVILDPQFTDQAEMLASAVAEMVGHPHVYVIPMPLNSLKFYQVDRDLKVEVPQEKDNGPGIQ